MLIHAPERGGLKSQSIRYPGFADPAGLERRQLRYGEALHLELGEGDLLNIVNDEGAAVAWLTPLDSFGLLDPASLGLDDGRFLDLVSTGWDRRAFDAWLSARGLSEETLRSYPLFDAATEPGDVVTLHARTVARSLDRAADRTLRHGGWRRRRRDDCRDRTAASAGRPSAQAIG